MEYVATQRELGHCIFPLKVHQANGARFINSAAISASQITKHSHWKWRIILYACWVMVECAEGEAEYHEQNLFNLKEWNPNTNVEDDGDKAKTRLAIHKTDHFACPPLFFSLSLSSELNRDG